MTNSYYTSLCRAWLDHEVLNRPGKKERLVEMIISATAPHSAEKVCEWIIGELQDGGASNTRSQLIDHQEDIDLVSIADILSREYCMMF